MLTCGGFKHLKGPGRSRREGAISKPRPLALNLDTQKTPSSNHHFREGPSFEGLFMSLGFTSNEALSCCPDRGLVAH